MKKLAIIGGHKDTREDAPYHDANYEIWGLTIGPNQPWFPRCDAVIEIHKSPLYCTHPDDPTYWAWLQGTDATAWMFDIRYDINNQRVYPLYAIKNSLLHNITINGEAFHNFGSSADYALALAILQGYKHIEIYGIEMSADSEYFVQQVSWAFWVGYAAGNGITVDLRSGGHMFDRPLYGRCMVGEDKHLGFLSIRTPE